jgi:hypothetical protein
MSDDLRKQIYLNFSQRDTDDLLDIWRTHDRYEWSEQTFDVVREILQERRIELPPQSAPVYTKHKLRPAAIREGQEEPQVEAPEDEPASEASESRDTNPARPKTVIYAVYAALGALAIGLALSAVNLAAGQFRTVAAYPQFAAIIALIGIGFLVLEAFLIYGTWLGRNGPRILYIGLALFSIVSGLTNGGWAERLAAQPLRTGLSFVPMCLDLIAVVLLVLPISNAWFREMRPAKVSAAQTTQKKKPRPQKRRLPAWLSELSPDRWVKHYTFGTLAISFAVSLLAAWLVYNLVLWLQEPDYPFDGYPNIMYAMLCLPMQAIALLLGALIGAISARTPEARWRQATYGVWIMALVAILSAIFGAGVLPKSGV